MEKRYQLIGSGYTSMDRLIKINKPVRKGFTSLVSNSDHQEIYYGGCSPNICYLLNKLGSTALPVIRVGSDWTLNGYKDYLSGAGVPLDAVHELSDEPTSSSYIIEDDTGDHITLFHPGAMDGKYAEKLDDIFFKQSAFGLMTVASKEDNEFFYQQCKTNDLPLILGMKMDTSAFPKSFLHTLLCYASIIFTNESESEAIVDLFELESITDFFNMGNVNTIVITSGKHGSRFFRKEIGSIEEGHVEICPTDGKVIDFTGAGDAYIAGFLHGYFNKKSILECCELGSVCSSFIIEKMGCTTNAPDYTQLQQRYQKWKGTSK